MSWNEIHESFNTLLTERNNGNPITQQWNEFKTIVNENRDKPPYHLVELLSLLEQLSEGRDKKSIIILDHGCGHGLTLLYLLALGYEGIYGANVFGECEKWNSFLKSEYHLDEKRFFIYDGKSLPLEDNFVDFVFSQQVLEHVTDEFFESYYKEEGRVLKNKGIAYHQVPHRLSPYDSHTGLWFVHYFPKQISYFLYKCFGKDVNHIKEWIHLRWPSVHLNKLIKYIGHYENITIKRLINIKNMEYYEGPLKLRLFIGKLVRFPYVGKLFAFFITRFVMLETCSIKSSEVS